MGYIRTSAVDSPKQTILQGDKIPFRSCGEVLTDLYAKHRPAVDMGKERDVKVLHLRVGHGGFFELTLEHEDVRGVLKIYVWLGEAGAVLVEELNPLIAVHHHPDVLHLAESLLNLPLEGHPLRSRAGVPSLRREARRKILRRHQVGPTQPIDYPVG